MSRAKSNPHPVAKATQKVRPQDLAAIQRIARALGRDGVTVVAAAVYLLKQQGPAEQLVAIHLMERDAIQQLPPAHAA